MAWYDNAYHRGYADFFGSPGYYSGYGAGYGYTPWGTRAGYDRGYGDYGGYARDYRRRPEQSPTYGRAADRAALRYARSHGYDTGFAMQPNRGGRFGGYYGSRDYAGRGGYAAGDYPGWTEGDYDWGYRW